VTTAESMTLTTVKIGEKQLADNHIISCDASLLEEEAKRDSQEETHRELNAFSCMVVNDCVTLRQPPSIPFLFSK
jgi:hypothetical protein